MLFEVNVHSMTRRLLIIYRQSTRVIAVFFLVIFLGIIRWFFDDSLISPLTRDSIEQPILFYRRSKCSCTRLIYGQQSNLLVVDETSTSLCSQYATLRGAHQKIIAISMYGPKENVLFNLNDSVNFLHELIFDMNKIYPNWILRVYHDQSLNDDLICSIECSYHNVDFCNASQLGSLGSISDYMPPKIWRFLPAGDLLVDMIISRDLDSPLSQRELDAVNQWLSTNKSWHIMRDHPLHQMPILGLNFCSYRKTVYEFVCLLGGMWGFHCEYNRTFAREFLNKLLNRTLISRYGGRDNQTFLTEHVWPYIQNDMFVHDSYLCETFYGRSSHPWPTRRPSLNESHCFVGCIRPCCPPTKFPLGECPIACRPKHHQNWTMC